MRSKEESLRVLQFEIQILESIQGTYPHSSTEHFVLSEVILNLQKDYLEFLWGNQ